MNNKNKENLFSKIKSFIEKHDLIKSGNKIILGLSGGPDSVFLLHVLSNLRDSGKISEIITAHLDHEWRPESPKEAQFCLELSKQYNATPVVAKISELCLNLKFDGSKEEFARLARRHFFEKVKNKYNYDLIALAHHAQDQEETFFIRLIRGTSLSGLVSIRPKSGFYIRPILEINKREIIEFLDTNNIPYVTDPSNISHDYLRNKIRHLVIPELKKCDARFEQNFKNTLCRLSETEDFLQDLTKEKFNEICEPDPKIIEAKAKFIIQDTFNTKEKSISQKNLETPKFPAHNKINLNKFFNLHPVMQYRVLIYWLIQENLKFPTSQSFLDEIIKFLQQTGSKTHKIHHNWSIIKKKNIASLQSNE